jgi:hypothetical protein
MVAGVQMGAGAADAVREERSIAADTPASVKDESIVSVVRGSMTDWVASDGPRE